MSTTLEKWGYHSFWDVVAFGAGLYGLGFSVANMVARMISVSGSYGIAGFTAFMTYLFIIVLYLGVAFFPATARLYAKRAKGNIMADEAMGRKVILFLGAWTAFFLYWLDPVNPWAHFPVFVVLVIVLLAGKKRVPSPVQAPVPAVAPAPGNPVEDKQPDGEAFDGIPGVRER